MFGEDAFGDRVERARVGAGRDLGDGCAGAVDDDAQPADLLAVRHRERHGVREEAVPGVAAGGRVFGEDDLAAGGEQGEPVRSGPAAVGLDRLADGGVVAGRDPSTYPLGARPIPINPNPSPDAARLLP